MSSIPTFSLAERERRWSTVRAAMRRHQLEAIVGLPNSSHWDQFQADVRYLTQIGGNCTEGAVIFPLEGEVTAVLRGETDIAWWALQQDWVKDMRQSRRTWALPIAERLQELGLASGRIGICGLEGMPRAPEGVVIWGLMERLKQQLSKAQFINATPALHEARTVKGPEEVEFLRKASGVAEAAVDRMLELARPGVPERRVYGAMVEAMIANGGEIPTMILWGAGQNPPWPHRMLTDRVLQAGDIVNNEVEGRWAGYIAQVVAPFSLGPVEAEHKRVFDASAEMFEDLRAFMKPGVRFVDIQRRYLDHVQSGGFDPGGALMHGRGLGDDFPLMWGNRPVDDDSLTLEAGMVFILKPAAFPLGGTEELVQDGEVVELALRAGDTVVITQDGAQRLGNRKMELLEV